ncbi:MAG: hypothetical protein K9H49_07820 [Bacteroidales bacterium]|nr:hypothetical protein [Bacteroidales bacterium]MCF8404540.1 hypothetical protein [Bacteroidales bacterium]
MNVLIQIRDNSFDREINEFIEGGGNRILISHSTEESIHYLSVHTVHKAVISLKNLKDAAILKYINDYYPAIEVVVIANKTFDDVISIFQKSTYSVIHEPLRLSELTKQIETKSKFSEAPNKIHK